MSYASTTISLTGNDTLVIGGRCLHDFADGNFAELSYPNELIKVKVAKNGNALYAFDATGQQCDLKVRITRGSLDDKFLNSILQSMRNLQERFVLVSANLTKRVGNGFGMVTNDTYILSGGVPTKNPGAASNAEGDTEQSAVVYEFKFTNSNRPIM